MKLTLLLPLAALGHSLVLPEPQIFEDLEVQSHDTAQALESTVQALQYGIQRISEEAESQIDSVLSKSEDAIDVTSSWASETASFAGDELKQALFAGKEWLSSVETDAKRVSEGGIGESLEALGIKDYTKPHHGGHHHHHEPNQTVYELIAKSKYTTILAKLISEDDDLVKLLNGTSANFTIFAPTDHAFEKLHKPSHKPSKEQIRRFLTYHVSDEFFPAGRVLVTRTIPTLLEESSLGDGNPQRVATEIGFRGLTVNFYSRIVAVNIFGTNGVIHGLDSVLFPPPKAYDIINYLPSEFSTLNLGLTKTGLDKTLNGTHGAGTLFAPSNFAFSKLGPRLNGFLFSKYGLKYLEAILKYHAVPGYTLYSDTLYNTTTASDHHHHGIPKGVYHVDLPTLLKDRSLSVDIARYGRLIEIKLNAFFRVSVSDGIAKDGVIHELQDVLIPPKHLGETPSRVDSEMTIESLIERLSPFVDQPDDDMECTEPEVWDAAYESVVEL